jgi:retinol dehydrogenase-14
MTPTDAGPIDGKTVLITGATSGIGRATAFGLAAMGAQLAITGRERSRVEAVAGEISTVHGGTVRFFVADLSAQQEVRRLAHNVLDQLPQIDVLINNAGGCWNSRHATADGLERTFAVNHLAPFLLTQLLLDRLKGSSHARVVNVASNAHALGRIDFADLQGAHSYSGARAYNQSKLANVLFTNELARRLAGTTVTANSVHPGLVDTNFGADDPGHLQRLIVPLLRPFMRAPVQGAATSVRVASAPELEHTTGRYFANLRPRRSARRSHDEAVALRLWRVSDGLVAPRSSTRCHDGNSAYMAAA